MTPIRDSFSKLERLADLSRELLNTISAAEPEKLGEIQSQREALLTELFASERLPFYSQEHHAVIQEIWALEQQLLKNTKRLRQQLFESARGIQCGRQAAQKYQENTT